MMLILLGLSLLQSAIISDQVNIWKELHAAQCAGVTPAELGPLSRLLKQWLDDDDLRQSFGRRGQLFARQRYDWTRIAGHWVGHYQEIIRRGRQTQQPLSSTV